MLYFVKFDARWRSKIIPIGGTCFFRKYLKDTTSTERNPWTLTRFRIHYSRVSIAETIGLGYRIRCPNSLTLRENSLITAIVPLNHSWSRLRASVASNCRTPRFNSKCQALLRKRLLRLSQQCHHIRPVELWSSTTSDRSNAVWARSWIHLTSPARH